MHLVLCGFAFCFYYFLSFQSSLCKAGESALFCSCTGSGLGGSRGGALFVVTDVEMTCLSSRGAAGIGDDRRY